eukprot:365431-Chlamydomonas_euryale.AAC.6
MQSSQRIQTPPALVGASQLTHGVQLTVKHTEQADLLAAAAMGGKLRRRQFACVGVQAMRHSAPVQSRASMAYVQHARPGVSALQSTCSWGRRVPSRTCPLHGSACPTHGHLLAAPRCSPDCPSCRRNPPGALPAHYRPSPSCMAHSAHEPPLALFA